MLHILLLILKIILWIILGALGLVLLLLLLVLFCPIKYQLQGSYHGGKTALATVKVRYLCVSFKLYFDQATGKLEQIIRIFGIRFGGDKKAEIKDDKPKKEKQKKVSNKSKKPKKIKDDFGDFDDEEWTEYVHESSDIPLIELEDSNETNETDNKTETETIDDASNQDQEPIDEEFDLFDDDIDKDVPKKEQKKKGRIKLFFQNVWKKLKSIYNFLENHTPDKIMEKVETKTEKLKKKIARLKKFWNLSCTVKTRAYLKKYIKTFFKHILPRKIKGYVHYGMAEPYKTSQVTGYLSLMPFVYKKGFSFIPDFQEKTLELDIKMKGRITLGYLLRIVLNINLWRTIRVAKKVLDK